MAVNDLILTNYFFTRGSKVSVFRKFEKMCSDFVGVYKGKIEINDIDDFNTRMLSLNLHNNNVDKFSDGYRFKKPVRFGNKKACNITGFFDATDYITTARRKRKRMYSGIVAFLKCGGIIRVYDNDFCYYDIDDLKKILK